MAAGDRARRRRLEEELLAELELEDLEELDQADPLLDAVYDEDELGIDPEEDYECRG